MKVTMAYAFDTLSRRPREFPEEQPDANAKAARDFIPLKAVPFIRVRTRVRLVLCFLKADSDVLRRQFEDGQGTRSSSHNDG
jgi:hypothetical protein